MPINIPIPEDEMKYLSTQAQTELQSVTITYCKDLLEEASRLEATGETGGGNPEITRNMIKDANLLLRRGYRRTKGLGLVAAQILAMVGSLLTGLLMDLDLLKQALWLVIFICLLIITITTTVWLILKE